MSLDIYAKVKTKRVPEYETLDTSYRMWSREERRKYCTELTNRVLKINITHNLGEMASKVPISFHTDNIRKDTDLYHIMWRPEEVFTEKKEIKLKDVVEPLMIGFNYLISHENELSQYNPENDWGHYENFVYCLPMYIRACYKRPNAILEISR